MNEIAEYEEGNQPVPQHTLPIVDIQAVKDYWDSYKELTEVLLDQSDYQSDGKKKFKKKSAWRKYATAFNFDTEILEKEIIRDDQQRIITAVYTVKAIAPNGRSDIGVGACSIWDKAHEHDKVDGNGRVKCKGPCDGRKHFDKPENDIVTTAHTRAKSRAIADLIGTGEVSAEEIDFNTSNGNGPTPQGNSGRQRQTRQRTTRTRESNQRTRPAKEEYKSEMPKAEKVRNPEPDEPENVQEAQLTGESYWKQLAEENSTLHIVIAALTKNETPINKKNILETSADLIGEGVLDSESRRDLLTFLQDKNEPD